MNNNQSQYPTVNQEFANVLIINFLFFIKIGTRMTRIFKR